MIKQIAVVGFAYCLTGGAQAALFDRGGGAVYDDVLNVTWLADWNYAYTSGYSSSGVEPGPRGPDVIWVDGRMGWNAANAWAANLVFGGYDDWRLPTGDIYQSPGPQNEYKSVWLSAGSSLAGLQAYFQVEDKVYWSSSELSGIPFPSAFGFNSDNGGLFGYAESGATYAVAVRNGDVPVPATLALLGLGLAGIGAARRKQA